MMVDMDSGTQDAGENSAAPDGGAQGTSGVFDRLLPELRAAAKRLMNRQPAGHTLQPTALVNEAYLKLFGGKLSQWANDRHFLTLSSLAMRQVLVDHARRANASTRLDRSTQVPLDHVVLAYEASGFEVLDLNDALNELADFDCEMAEILTCRFFLGESPGDLAERFDIPLRTLERRWASAYAWLLRRLK